MDWHYSILWIVLIFKVTCGEYCLRTLDTVRDVASCPRNKEEWEAASKRKDCSHVKTGNCENVTYHCLRDAVTNTMVEVCTVPKNLQGRCPHFYRDPPYVRNDYDRDCRNSSRCPDFYSSKDAYNYSACYNDSSIYAFGIAKGTEKSNNWILVFFLVILFLLIVVYIIAVIWVKKRKRISLRKALCILRHILQDKEVSLRFEDKIRKSQSEVNDIREFMTRMCGRGKLSDAEDSVTNMEIEMKLIENKSSNTKIDLAQKNNEMKKEFRKIKKRILKIKKRIYVIGYPNSSEKNSTAVQAMDGTQMIGYPSSEKNSTAVQATDETHRNESKDSVPIEQQSSLEDSSEEKPPTQEDSLLGNKREIAIYKDEDVKIINELKSKDPAARKFDESFFGKEENENFGHTPVKGENPDPKQKEFQGPLANLNSKINEVKDEIKRITDTLQEVVGSGRLDDNEKAIETLNKDVTQLEKQVYNNGMKMEIRMHKCEERVIDLEERVNKYKKLHGTY